MRRFTRRRSSYSDFVRSLLVALLFFGGDMYGFLGGLFDAPARHAGHFAQSAFDLASQRLVRDQEITDRITSLAQSFAMIGIPRAGLFQYFLVDAEVHQFAGFRNPLREENIKFRLLEGR